MSISILASPYAAAFGACVFFYFIVFPVVNYFRDVNGQCTFFVTPHISVRAVLRATSKSYESLMLI